MTRDNLYIIANEALAAFGVPMQMRRFAEECGEAVTAVMKCHDNRGIHPHSVAEEIVGVLITAAQMERWLVEVIGVDAMNEIWGQQLAKLTKAIEAAR
jgi:hypothetical protein